MENCIVAVSNWNKNSCQTLPEVLTLLENIEILLKFCFLV